MKAFFFDMDGVIYDSMPNHAQAWEEVMSRHHLPFTAYDCYLNEGRTGVDIITTLIRETRHYEPSNEEVQTIFRQKGDAFVAKGGAGPVKGIADVMAFLHSIRRTFSSGLRNVKYSKR